MMFNYFCFAIFFFVRFALLGFCFTTLLAVWALEVYVVVVVVTLLLQFIPRAANALSTYYLPYRYLPRYLVNCTNDTFLTSANFLDLVLVLLGGSIPIPLTFPLSLMTFRLMRPMSHPNESNVFSFLLFFPLCDLTRRRESQARLG